MTSIQDQKINLVADRGCSGVDCVPLMIVSPDWSVRPSGNWYAQTWRAATNGQLVRLDATGPSANEAMDRLTTVVVAFS